MLDADAFVRRLYSAMKTKPAPAVPAAPAAASRPRDVGSMLEVSVRTNYRRRAHERALHSADTAEPNLTPMLDMVFQLVTFFMLVINFQAASLDMSLKLPVVGSARPVETRGRRPARA